MTIDVDGKTSRKNTGKKIGMKTGMSKVAIAIMCKTPAPGLSKTRLSPPLHPSECAALSACFIQDLSSTIAKLAESDGIVPYAVYTPIGSEASLAALLPAGFRLTPQCEGDFGARLLQGIVDLLADGHAGVILVNSDSPTLPIDVLRAAATAVRRGDRVVLSPAIDGGYTMIGLSKIHARLFDDIPWSTSDVYSATLQRAAEIGIDTEIVHGWYDVDDAASLRMLEDELSGIKPAFIEAGIEGAIALHTRTFMGDRQRRSKVKPS